MKNNTLSHSVISNSEIILDREDIYNPKKLNVWCFKHVDDIVEGVKLDLCNMTSQSKNIHILGKQLTFN